MFKIVFGDPCRKSLFYLYVCWNLLSTRGVFFLILKFKDLFSSNYHQKSNVSRSAKLCLRLFLVDTCNSYNGTFFLVQELAKTVHFLPLNVPKTFSDVQSSPCPTCLCVLSSLRRRFVLHLVFQSNLRLTAKRKGT